MVRRVFRKLKRLLGLGKQKESPLIHVAHKIHISPQELNQRLQEGPPVVLLDVREPWEFQQARIEGSVLIPLKELPQKVQSLNPEDEIVVLCHHGVRSLHACGFLAQQGFGKLRNLMGGIDAWSLSVDPKIPRYR